jgi:hypothetical protein
VKSRTQRCLLAIVSLGILLAAGLASGAESEITISNTAIRAMLMDQLYTDDDKFHLLRGARCQFAYLELPAVVITRGRVHIRTRLTGMLGVEGVLPRDRFGKTVFFGRVSWSNRPACRSGVQRVIPTRLAERS